MTLPDVVPGAIHAAARSVGDALTAYSAAEPASPRPQASIGEPRPAFVACSGGPDSLALAVACAHATRIGLLDGWRIGAVIVDHGLQDGSDAVATRTAAQVAALGLAPVEVVRVDVPLDSGEGLEAGARRVRYDAFEATVPDADTPVLLGHTLDDQAETVLMRLARGSGARSLAAMAPRRGRYLRPLLGQRRADLASALGELGLTAFADPHNADPAFLRARVRHTLMPVLAEVLGSHAVPALARSADLLRDDADALDARAAEALALARTGPAAAADSGRDGSTLDAVALSGLAPAVLNRVLRAACVEAGASPGGLTARHVASVAGLVTNWRGQGPVSLPGGLMAARVSGTLSLTPTSRPHRAGPDNQDRSPW